MHFEPLVVSIIGGLIGLALVSVLVSKSANTTSVLSGAGSALSTVIKAAVSPVSGSSTLTSGSTSSLYGGSS